MTKIKYIFKRNNYSRPESLISDIMEARGLKESDLDVSMSKLINYSIKIPNISEAANLVCDHILKSNRIVGVCDYDCDGVTSGSQLKLFMDMIGYSKFKIITPDRHIDGYGVPKSVVESRDFDLMITMDCGTIDKSVFLAKENNADVVVIDHHECSDRSLLAPANYVINPKICNERLGFIEPCGSGLTFMFIIMLRRVLISRGIAVPQLNMNLFALAAIGTIADMVPLREVNRVIAYHGLKALNTISSGPISVFKEVSGYGSKKINAGIIGFQLGPRINAAGRIDHGCYPIEMFTTREKDWCEDIAHTLSYLNELRKNETNEIVLAIQKRVFANEFEESSSLVLSSKKWPSSIVGICASQIIQSSFYGPVILFQENKKNKTLKGSGRSIPGFDLYSALMECRDLIDKWGGHEMAAGLTLSKKNYALFVEKFEAISRQRRESNPDVFLKKIKVDAFVNFKDITQKLIESLQLFEPFGMGNPNVVLGTNEVKVIQASRITSKAGQFLGMRYKLSQRGELPYVEAISWDTYATPLETIGFYNVYYKPAISNYNNAICLDLVGWN